MKFVNCLHLTLDAKNWSRNLKRNEIFLINQAWWWKFHVLHNLVCSIYLKTSHRFSKVKRRRRFKRTSANISIKVSSFSPHFDNENKVMHQFVSSLSGIDEWVEERMFVVKESHKNLLTEYQLVRKKDVKDCCCAYWISNESIKWVKEEFLHHVLVASSYWLL